MIFEEEIYINYIPKLINGTKLSTIPLVFAGKNGISRTGSALCLEGVQHVGFSSSRVSFMSEDILQTPFLTWQPRVPKVVSDILGKSREKDLRNHKVSLPVQGT